MSEHELETVRQRTRGQFLFALIFLSISLLLFSLLTTETVWVEDAVLFAQPRFWPGVALLGMSLFGILHLLRLGRRNLERSDIAEGAKWLRALEFVLWFMLYVFVVPIFGYLPTSLAFVPILAFRMGYRNRRTLWAAAAFGFAVVCVFKTFLAVKIPGGDLYEILPGFLRNFLIVNF